MEKEREPVTECLLVGRFESALDHARKHTAILKCATPIASILLKHKANSFLLDVLKRGKMLNCDLLKLQHSPHYTDTDLNTHKLIRNFA